MTSRISHLLSTERFVSAASQAFVACPAVLVQFACPAQAEAMREVYRLAYEQARDLHRPSRWVPLYQTLNN
jgi:hypothetical protein